LATASGAKPLLQREEEFQESFDQSVMPGSLRHPDTWFPRVIRFAHPAGRLLLFNALRAFVRHSPQ